ncbi:MAG TPA: imidazolonepropionase [Deinococcales bacterium]|nr:imidazolonepropionase [Deinococcales bacterium]
MRADLLLRNVRQLATPPGPGPRRGHAMRELTVIEGAALAVIDGRISWAGREADWEGESASEHDAGGRAVVPGLVDPHTHAVWAGDRLADFEARTSGRTYEEILRAGGGIRSTVRATAERTPAELAAIARPRLDALLRSGATTVEVKSGYGFTPEAELRSLEAIALLRADSSVDVHPTLLVHVPPQEPARREDYVAAVCADLIPEAARRGLATAVDVFVEREAFSADEARAILTAARRHGLALKVHADQFTAIGAVELAVELGALSADHLEASGPAQVAALAQGRTVATVLPGVTLHLGLPPAPARALVDAGAAVAIATDLNPGSSPLFSTAAALALAVRLNGLTPAEALTAGTANAAAALSLSDRGHLTSGARADFLVLDADDWRELPYRLGSNPVAEVWRGGTLVRPGSTHAG